MNKQIIGLLLSCLIGVYSTAQNNMLKKSMDSTIAYITQPDAFPNPKRVHQKITLKPAGDFDQRFSFLESQPVNIWGYRIGVFVNDKYKVGIGGYFLEQTVTGEQRLRRNAILKYQQDRKLYFGTIYYEPFLLRKRLYETSLVFEAGYGKVSLDSTKTIRNRQTTVSEKQNFVPIGMGVSVNFKIPDMKHLHFLTYIGLNAMIGLRKTVFETDLKYNYDGWYWSIGSAVFIDKIFSDIKANKKRKAAAKQQNSTTTPTQ
jgi:hypothetical protein